MTRFLRYIHEEASEKQFEASYLNMGKPLAKRESSKGMWEYSFPVKINNKIYTYLMYEMNSYSQAAGILHAKLSDFTKKKYNKAVLSLVKKFCQYYITPDKEMKENKNFRYANMKSMEDEIKEWEDMHQEWVKGND